MSKIKTVGYIAGVSLLTIGTYRFLKKKREDKHFVEEDINDGFIPGRKYTKLANVTAADLDKHTDSKVKKIS